VVEGAGRGHEGRWKTETGSWTGCEHFVQKTLQEKHHYRIHCVCRPGGGGGGGGGGRPGGLRPLGAVVTVALLAEEEDWGVGVGEDDRCLRVTAASCDCKPPWAGGPWKFGGLTSGERDREGDCRSLVRLCTCMESKVKGALSHFTANDWQ